MSAEAASPAAKQPGALERFLDVIERVGNKVPHPALMFLALCVGVIGTWERWRRNVCRRHLSKRNLKY